MHSGNSWLKGSTSMTPALPSGYMEKAERRDNYSPIEIGNLNNGI